MQVNFKKTIMEDGMEKITQQQLIRLLKEDGWSYDVLHQNPLAYENITLDGEAGVVVDTKDGAVFLKCDSNASDWTFVADPNEVRMIHGEDALKTFETSLERLISDYYKLIAFTGAPPCVCPVCGMPLVVEDHITGKIQFDLRVDGRTLTDTCKYDEDRKSSVKCSFPKCGFRTSDVEVTKGQIRVDWPRYTLDKYLNVM